MSHDKLETDFSNEINTLDIPNRLSTAFDVEAFDEAIRAHGVRFIHYRGMRNPVGLIDRYDSRRPDPDHSGSSNGLIYTRAGCVTALFVGNSKEVKAQEQGLIDAGTAQLTTPRFYDDTGEPIYLHPMDRLYLEEESILVTHQQLVDAHASGNDRLKFPVAKALDVIDALGIRYHEGTDFKVADGKIQWCGPNRPGINPENGKGRVYAIRYLYKPYWYIDRMLHEIRVVQFENPMTGARGTVRMPQSAIVQREYIYEVEDKDEQAPDPNSSRQNKGPANGGFGPR